MTALNSTVGYRNNLWPATNLAATGCQTVSAIDELEHPKKLIKIIDLLGRTTQLENNKLFFYIYEGGTVEKRLKIE